MVVDGTCVDWTGIEFHQLLPYILSTMQNSLCMSGIYSFLGHLHVLLDTLQGEAEAMFLWDIYGWDCFPFFSEYLLPHCPWYH